jgi:NAD(P)-dependent dehydrogenase (short-subunit alcohol dehydrogenase family)
VAVLARGADGVGEAVKDVENADRRGLGITVDVADLDALDAAADRVERELGPIDVWVNVAFVGALAYFWDTSPEEFRRITEVTYYGQVHGTRVALARMRPRDRGTIVNVCSAMAFRGIPLQSAYCGAKHAIKGFTESVITELRHEHSHVKVCMLQLPGLNTPQFTWNLNRMPQHPMPVPPIYAPSLAGRAVAFLAEHPRRNIWLGLPTAYTILGERVAPLFLDWYLGRTGVDSQQTSRVLPRFDNNLFSPVPGDHGADGPFSEQAHTRSGVLWAAMHRRALIATGAAAAGGLAGWALRR